MYQCVAVVIQMQSHINMSKLTVSALANSRTSLTSRCVIDNTPRMWFIRVIDGDWTLSLDSSRVHLRFEYTLKFGIGSSIAKGRWRVGVRVPTADKRFPGHSDGKESIRTLQHTTMSFVHLTLSCICKSTDSIVIFAICSTFTFQHGMLPGCGDVYFPPETATLFAQACNGVGVNTTLPKQL